MLVLWCGDLSGCWGQRDYFCSPKVKAEVTPPRATLLLVSVDHMTQYNLDMRTLSSGETRRDYIRKADIINAL